MTLRAAGNNYILYNMKSVYPQRLKKGDEIRVIAPSLSLTIVSKANIAIAQRRLTNAGFNVSFGKHVYEKDSLESASIQSRVADMHEAFFDKNVKMVLCAIGGYNANQILDHLDFNLIRANPKAFCGYSDITVLNNAIYERSGLVTYSGPGFSAFAMKSGFNYSLEYFLKCFTNSSPFVVRSSPVWSDDRWYRNQSTRVFIKNSGLRPLRIGTARGIIVGGNLCSFNLLQGTKYLPRLRNTILFIEEDDLAKGTAFIKEFGRNLQSLTQQPGFDQVRGLVLGRFQKKCLVTNNKLRELLSSMKKLRVPIIAGVDFGHTTPQITIPIGGEARIEAGRNSAKIEILRH